MEKKLEFFAPELGIFPARYIRLTYQEKCFCYKAELLNMQGEVVYSPDIAVGEKSIMDNIEARFYLLIEDSLVEQVQAGLIITSIGQLTKKQVMQLNRAVKKGLIKKGLGGGFPKAKTVYTPLNYDIPGERKKEVDILLSFWTGGRIKAA